MICIYCNEEIKEDEKKYFSKQPGMKGLYHWKCFTKACRDLVYKGSKHYPYDSSSEYTSNDYSSNYAKKFIVDD